MNETVGETSKISCLGDLSYPFCRILVVEVMEPNLTCFSKWNAAKTQLPGGKMMRILSQGGFGNFIWVVATYPP